MDQAEFQRRTKQAGLNILRICDDLPRKPGADAIARQLVRSATSVGANYRASCRAKSLRDVLYKLGIVEEEADETLYWLELLAEGGYAQSARIAPVQDEMHQILAMTVASRRTLRARLANSTDPTTGSPNRRRAPESTNRRIDESKNHNVTS